MAAPQLTSTQQHNSLGNKNKKIISKNVLCTPYISQWPKLEKSLEQDILLRLVEIITKVDLKRPTINKKLKRSERKLALKECYNTLTDEQKSLRLELVCGINEVTKNLEKDKLVLVLVNNGGSSLTKHLIQLAGVRNCPAIHLPGLEKCVAPLISATQLSCLGFRKIDDSKTQNTSFKKFTDYVASKVPKIDLPWLSFEKSLYDFIAGSGSADLDSSDDNNGDEHNVKLSDKLSGNKTDDIVDVQIEEGNTSVAEKGSSINTSNVPVISTKKKKTEKKNISEDFISIEGKPQEKQIPDFNNINWISIHDFSSTQHVETTPVKGKKRKGEKKKEKAKKVRKEEILDSSYQKMNLHKLKSNDEKKKNKKKKAS